MARSKIAWWVNANPVNSLKCLKCPTSALMAASVMAKGASLLVLTDNSMSKALSLMGTRLDVPFLVMGKNTDFFSSSICSQRRPRISLRLVPVSISMTTIGQRFHEREALAVSSNHSYSPALRRRSLGGLFFGILMRLRGMSPSGQPHSMRAIFHA